MPWPQTSPADSVRRATAHRLKQFTLVLSLLAGVAAAVALAALVPLLAGPTQAERVHTQLLIVLFPAALSFGALLGLVLVQWRARRLAADTLRRTARELQRGAWRSAVERMRDMPNSPARQKIIDAMVGIARNDAPWIWGFFPKDYLLYHGWLSNVKPNDMARNDIKYLRLHPARREALLNGLDEIGMTMNREAEIAAFQARDRNRRPWIYR